jgi:zinc protease
MVASVLDQGTSTRSAQQIADTVDAIGGDLRVGAGTDVTFASVTVLKDSVAPGLELLSDIVRSPAFAQAELDRQREQLRSALRVSYQDPDYVASVVFKPPVRVPRHRHAGVHRAHPAERPRRVPPALLHARQQHPRDGG